MSLMIKGMDVPKNCRRCPCDCEVGAGIYICAAIKDIVEIEDTSKRQSYCPVFEIPTPHGRLIDADRLIAVLKSAIPYEQRTSTVLCVIKNIENAPTVIEAEG